MRNGAFVLFALLNPQGTINIRELQRAFVDRKNSLTGENVIGDKNAMMQQQAKTKQGEVRCVL